GGVASLNGETGALTLANASGSSGTITINDASTAQKGIAQFNSTNFSVAGGVVNTIQNIATTSSPTFAGLTLTAPLSVANGGTGATDATNARANLSAAASGANSDITSLGAVTLINPSAALTVGSSGFQLSLQGNDTSEWVVTDSGFSTTIGFETPTANVDFLFPALAAGSYEICTSDGNCASGPVGANTSLSNLSS